MPLMRIDVVRGRSEKELATLAQAVHDAMIEAFQTPARDRYQVLTEHAPACLILEDTGLGFERSDQRVLIQMTTRERPEIMKLRFYELVVAYLGDRCGIPPEDVMVSCIENKDADWTFAHGRAQFLTGEL
jgi:phenylpyruvate tautomerase PptA (4-oxalocrotonate tautomerase family)